MKTIEYPYDRQAVEERYAEKIVRFASYNEKKGLSRNYISTKKTQVLVCLHILEEINCKLEYVNMSTLDSILAVLSEYDASAARSYVNCFADFVSFINGTDRLQITDRKASNPNYRYNLGEFRFAPELDQYIQYASGRLKMMDVRRNRIIIACRIIDYKYPAISLDEIDNEKMQYLESELEKCNSRKTILNFLNAIGDFCSLFRSNPYVEYKSSKNVNIVFTPRNKYDLQFLRYVEDFRDWMLTWKSKPHTIKNSCCSIVKCYEKLTEVKGGFYVRDMIPTDFALLWDKLLVDKYAESTTRSYLSKFGMFLKIAVGSNIYDQTHIRFNGDNCKRQFITIDDFIKLHDVADPLQKVMLSLGATMGVRRHEMVSLRLEDLESEKLTVRGKGTGAQGKVDRMGLTELVVKDLREWLVERQRIIQEFGDRSQGRLLISNHRKTIGMPLTDRLADLIFEDVGNRTGVSYTSHTLRRLYCMSMKRADVELDTIRMMMRHASLETTLRCYIHADPDRITSAKDVVNGVFSALK